MVFELGKPCGKINKNKLWTDIELSDHYFCFNGKRHTHPMDEQFECNEDHQYFKHFSNSFIGRGVLVVLFKCFKFKAVIRPAL